MSRPTMAASPTFVRGARIGNQLVSRRDYRLMTPFLRIRAMAEGIETSPEKIETSHDKTGTTAAAPVAADLHPTIAALVEGPKIEATTVESRAIQPRIEETAQAQAAPPVVMAPAEPTDGTAPTEASISQTLKTEPKMPPVAHLAETAAPAQAPPPFLREHATRIIAAKPPLRADAKPGIKPAVTAPPKAERTP